MSNRFCAGSERDDALEISCGIFVVRDGPPVTIKLVFARPPTGGIPFGNNPMNAIRREESIFDSLPKTVLINRVAEIEICVTGFLPQRSSCHSELDRWFEVFEDHAPCTIIAGAAAMAFIDNDKIKKIRRVLFEQTGPALIFGQSLINGKIHLPAFDYFAGLDFVPRVAEGGKDTIFGLIHEYVTVGEVKYTGPPVLARPVPAA